MKQLLTLVFVIALISCNTNKPVESTQVAPKIEKKTPVCNTMGTVKDHTGMDGCKFLIHLENGEKWLPQKVSDQTFRFADNQKIRFGYEVVPDGASVCMMENKIVNITCIEEVSTGKVNDCAMTEDPFSVDWMKEVMEKVKPEMVISSMYKGTPNYFFSVTRCCDQQSFLYSCRGKVICTDGGITGGDCKDLLKQLKNQKVIYQSEENQD